MKTDTARKKIDLHRIDAQYESAKESFRNASLSEVNKSLCLEYISDCELGWGNSQRIGKYRALKYFQTLRFLTGCLESLDPGLTWPFIELDHTKAILNITDHREWGEWQVHVHKISLRKFVTWLRLTKGYPKDYYDSGRLNASIRIFKRPPEVDFAISKPDTLKPFAEIPTEEEVDMLLRAWDEEIRYHIRRENFKELMTATRNKALISILADTGTRIGGIGGLRIGDIQFDNLGAKISVLDKTMRGEPVRLIFSVGALKDWLDLHPMKSNPAAPLWIAPETRKALNYDGLKKILKLTRTLHNSYARERGLPEITKRLHFHAFRYHAQIRDVLEGMPISIQCSQRGWSPSSPMPQHYARISSGQADAWIARHYNLMTVTDEDREAIEKIVSKRRAPKEGLPGYL